MSGNYAYVTLVMHQKHYLYGALVMGYSLKSTNTKHHVTCMVTDDLYDEFCDVLLTVFDAVFKVPYINYKCDKLRSRKIEELYGGWKDVAFTKWNCLSLVKYEKVCFLDADLIITQNIDSIFQINAPAGCFHNYWCDFKTDFRSNPTYGSFLKKMSIYNHAKYGDVVDSSLVQNGLDSGYVIIANCVLLEPCIDIYNNFLNYMEIKPNYPNCLSMVDEIVICDFMLKSKKIWHQLECSFNSIPWHMKVTHKTVINNKIDISNPKIIHFFNKKKPWITMRGTWYDNEIWWTYYDDMKKNIHNFNKFNAIMANLECFNTLKLDDVDQHDYYKKCPYCVFVNFELMSLRSLNTKNNKNSFKLINHDMVKNGKLLCTALCAI